MIIRGLKCSQEPCRINDIALRTLRRIKKLSDKKSTWAKELLEVL